MKVLYAISHMNETSNILRKNTVESSNLLFDFLRYPSPDMKEPAARLILKTLTVSQTEALHLLQALDLCDLSRPEIIHLVAQVCSLS